MTADREKQQWRLFVAALSIIAVLVVSTGAHSSAFHQWVHGDDVDCSLSHHSRVSHSSGEDSSEEEQPIQSDPLDSFCRTGYLLEVSPIDIVLVQPRVIESVGVFSSGFLPSRFYRSSPTRAPPVLI